MFHVKQFKYFYEIVFIIWVFAIPFQTRTLLNPANAYIEDYFSYHQAFFLYLTDILFLGFFVPWIIFGNNKNLNSRIFLKILAYLSLIFITLFHVKQLDLGLYQALKWLEMIGIVIFAWKNLNQEWLRNLTLGVLFISGIFQAIIAILQFHVQHSLGLFFLGEFIAPWGTPGLATIDAGQILIRSYGTMPHPNVLAGFLVIALIMGFYYVSRETSTLKWVVSCGTFVVILGIFFTFSRVGWLGTALAFLGFIGFNFLTGNVKALKTLLIIMLVSCGTLALGYYDLAKSRVIAGDPHASTLRTDFNNMGLEIIKKYPALGVGVGNYTEAQKDLFDLDGWQHQPPHNIYIYLAAELGLLGLGLFLVIIFDILKQAWQFIRQPLGFTLITVVILILIMGMFDHYFLTIQQGRMIFFLILGLVFAVGNRPAYHLTDL
jgi:O-antigen ligase